jgi:hypothetical protein
MVGQSPRAPTAASRSRMRATLRDASADLAALHETKHEANSQGKAKVNAGCDLSRARLLGEVLLLNDGVGGLVIEPQTRRHSVLDGFGDPPSILPETTPCAGSVLA